jgi:hypothetical protein
MEDFFDDILERILVEQDKMLAAEENAEQLRRETESRRTGEVFDRTNHEKHVTG